MSVTIYIHSIAKGVSGSGRNHGPVPSAELAYGY